MAQKINKALVVDDSRLARIALAKQLKNRGIEVDMAGTGGEGVDYLKSAHPDVVFMDFMMPDMDGFEAARRIFADPDCAKPPVVMYTSQDTDEDRAKAKAIGIADFLSKPSTDDQLDQVLQRLEAGLVFAEPPAEAAEPAPAPEVAAAAVPEAAPAPAAAPVQPAAAAAEFDWEQVRAAARDSALGAAHDAAERVVRERLAEFRQLLEEALRNTMVQAREAAADSAEAAARTTAEETARATAELVATQSALPMVESMDPESIGRTAREVAEQVSRESAEQVAREVALQTATNAAEQVAEQIALRVARQAGVEAAREQAGELQGELRKTFDTLIHGAEFKTQVKGVVFEHALPGIQQAVLSAATQAAREAAREAAEQAAAAAAATQAAALQELEARVERRLAELSQPSPFEPPAVKAPWLPGLIAGLAAGAIAAIVVAML